MRELLSQQLFKMTSFLLEYLYEVDDCRQVKNCRKRLLKKSDVKSSVRTRCGGACTEKLVCTSVPIIRSTSSARKMAFA